MDNASMMFCKIFVAFFYVCLVLKRRDNIWLIIAAFFVATTIVTRLIIDVDAVRDFRPYFDSFKLVQGNFVSPTLLIEPYRLALFKSAMLFKNLDSITQITIIYYAHFSIITSFFIWLAYLKNISIGIKLTFFFIFYPPMAFVWLRAGMGYALSCFLIYNFTQGSWKITHLLLPTVHMSTLPFLLISWTKKMSFNLRAIILVFLIVTILVAINSSYVNYAISKWNRYLSQAGEAQSLNIILVNIFCIIFYTYFFILNKKMRKNFIIISIMMIYLISFAISPVMGLRIYPFVLIAMILERINLVRYGPLTLVICLCLLPVYFNRFNQIFV